MIKELGTPGSGKSTKAILQAAKTGAYIICATRDDARRLVEQAEQMKVHIRNPVPMSDYLHDRMRGSFVRNIIIDDIEKILPSFFPSLQIEMLTMTVDLKRDATE